MSGKIESEVILGLELCLHAADGAQDICLGRLVIGEQGDIELIRLQLFPDQLGIIDTAAEIRAGAQARILIDTDDEGDIIRPRRCTKAGKNGSTADSEREKPRGSPQF